MWLSFVVMNVSCCPARLAGAVFAAVLAAFCDYCYLVRSAVYDNRCLVQCVMIDALCDVNILCTLWYWMFSAVCGDRCLVKCGVADALFHVCMCVYVCKIVLCVLVHKSCLKHKLIAMIG